LRRIGRLRWISGRRSAEENWDAYEGPAGVPLLNLALKPQSWEFVRFWLLDLAEELASAAKDGTTPETLSLDRVWINAEGRAKLLDFPAPGLKDSKRITGALEPELFLKEVAAFALQGRFKWPSNSTIIAAIPLHARRFLEDRKVLSDPDAAGRALKPLIQRPVQVTRARRAALVARCLVIPIFLTVVVISIGLSEIKSRPELQELSQLLLYRQSIMSNRESSLGLNADRIFSIYIAHHYRDTVRNSKLWNSAFPQVFIQPADRLFVEVSIQCYAEPTEAEITEAEAAINRAVPRDKLKQIKFWIGVPLLTIYVWLPIGFLLFLVAIPALIAAISFRGGLILLVFGLGVVREDGLPASRIRVFWRSLLTWAVLFIPDTVGRGLRELFYWPTGIQVVVILMMASLTVWSALLPDRGIPDRIAGTRLVPR
jgi:eukaryotic-like serine/threonine-protein kinase